MRADAPPPRPMPPGLPPLRPAGRSEGSHGTDRSDRPGPPPARRPVLVVCYSRTGHTRYLAQQIAGQCGGDLDEIVDRAGRGGLLGYLRSAIEGLLGLSAPIVASRRSPRDYDLVIVGTPVWAGHLASPVRSYLQHHRGQFRRVAFFCTSGRSGQDRALAEMVRLSGRPAAATLALRTQDVARRLHWRPVARFVRTLRNGRRAGDDAQERWVA